MKKLIYIITCIIALFGFVACGKTTDAEEQSAKNIVVTTWPHYQWVKNVVAGEDVHITMLMSGGADLHNYQPTVKDMAVISECDLLIYNGGESDRWVNDAIESTGVKDSLNVMEAIADKLKEEEGEEEAEYDEHIWLSLKNAQMACVAISEKLAEMMPESKDIFVQNAQSYCYQLAELDKQYRDVVSQSDKKVLLFGDRFPFRYLLDDYGIQYYAAFPGCSTESNASFETIIFLADKVDRLELNYIMTTENSDGRIAKSIAENTKTKSAKILALDSMQSAVSDDATYLSVMKNNLEILKEALN